MKVKTFSSQTVNWRVVYWLKYQHKTKKKSFYNDEQQDSPDLDEEENNEQGSSLIGRISESNRQTEIY